MSSDALDGCSRVFHAASLRTITERNNSKEIPQLVDSPVLFRLASFEAVCARVCTFVVGACQKNKWSQVLTRHEGRSFT